MIDSIFTILKTTRFDFRKHTPKNDPLEALFPQWIKYYQLKYAISKAIQPKSILETGVRFGYSAISFLEASPEAAFTGIDIDSEAYGGVNHAIEWAKKITQNYDAQFILADTTTMRSFPGKNYDLIHIDAQQNGDSTFDDLEKALEKGRFILVDGFFWSKLNMLSSTYFLEKYKNFIEYALVIPGYAGELLIKTKEKNSFHRKKNTYDTLLNAYDSNYYLTDCGGYDTFLRTKGHEVTDHRLLACIYLSLPAANKTILDIGSGRGELSYTLAKHSQQVTGLDYSKSAIDIAEKTYKNIHNLNFIHADIFSFTTEKKFDVILATDIIEHIEEAMLAKLFSKISTLLKEKGIFIIHTSPNKLSHYYNHSKKYKTAQEIGTYIPKNPNTYYEDLMHINEQTPARLNRSLKHSFKNVFIWTTKFPQLLGNLGVKPNKQDLRHHDSIFSVCSNDPIQQHQISSKLTQKALDPSTLNVNMILLSQISKAIINDHFKLRISIENLSSEVLTSLLPFPIYISYHWKLKNDYVIFEGLRTPFKLPLEKKSAIEMKLLVLSPKRPGNYILEITLLQEQQFWFEQILDSLPIKIPIAVTDRTSKIKS